MQEGAMSRYTSQTLKEKKNKPKPTTEKQQHYQKISLNISFLN